MDDLGVYLQQVIKHSGIRQASTILQTCCEQISGSIGSTSPKGNCRKKPNEVDTKSHQPISKLWFKSEDYGNLRTWPTIASAHPNRYRRAWEILQWEISPQCCWYSVVRAVDCKGSNQCWTAFWVTGIFWKTQWHAACWHLQGIQKDPFASGYSKCLIPQQSKASSLYTVYTSLLAFWGEVVPAKPLVGTASCY